MNKLQKLVEEYIKKNAIISKKISDEIIGKIDENTSPSEAEAIIRKTFAKYGVIIERQNLIEKAIIDAIGIGIGKEINGTRRVNAIKKWYLENAYSASGKKFSPTINDLNRIDEIVAEVRQSLKVGKSWRSAAQDLMDKGIQKADVAKDIQGLLDSARKAYRLSDNSAGYQQYLKQVRAVQKRIDRMVDPSTSKLKRAYQDILDITNKSSAVQIDNAAKYASYFKERYNAERIIRTETAQAYGDAFTTDNLYDEDSIGVRWVLSSAHPEFDICNVNASADLYGMGPGGYPKDHFPPFPAHPNCLPAGNRVYFKGNISAATKAFYSGIVVKVTTGMGKVFTVTANHPVLTRNGWIFADKLTKGIDVISSKFSYWISTAIDPNDNQRHPLIEDVFSSIKKSKFVTSVAMPSTSEDFHGDGKSINGYIDIIRTNSKLRYTFDAIVFKIFYDNLFSSRNIILNFLTCNSVFAFAFKCLMLSAHSVMSCFCNSLSSFWRIIKFIKQNKRLPNIANMDTGFYKPTSDNIAANPINVSNGLNRLSGSIAFDNIVNVEMINYNGHVYDLQVDDNEIYINNGVIVKNCLCGLEQIIERQEKPATQKDYDPKKMEKYLSGLSEQKRKELLGIKGAEKFDTNKSSWSKNLKNWDGIEKKSATIPRKVLYGK